MKRSVIILIILLSFSLIFSQKSKAQLDGYYIDGIRMAQNYYGSTARSISLGGAVASLGSDLGSISVNPAGIGVYRKSDFSFTTGLNAINTSSDYLGNKKNDIDYKLNIGNLGAVFTFNNGSSGWVSTSLAFGYNKLNNFSSSYTIEGTTKATNPTSLVNEFLSYANANGQRPETLDPFWERLAFDAYVIDTVPGTTNKYQSPYSDSISLSQKHTIEINGSGGEYYLGFGANYNNQLYLGVSVNIDEELNTTN